MATLLRSSSNASSGMGVADHCKDTFLELQRKKVHRYVIFKIDEKRKEVVVEKTGGAAESYDNFMAALPESDCRYAIYDFDFVTEENCQKSKIFFIAWTCSWESEMVPCKEDTFEFIGGNSSSVEGRVTIVWLYLIVLFVFFLVKFTANLTLSKCVFSVYLVSNIEFPNYRYLIRVSVSVPYPSEDAVRNFQGSIQARARWSSL